MKTLEGVLGVDDVETPQRGSISTRCAELDAEMPLLLGVTKPILEYVLFCHQEDSQWPLSEPAVLKMRFDDIFDATKYRRALDSIRALRKQRAQDARVDEAEIQALQQDRDRVSAIKGRIRVLYESAAHKESELATLDEHISAKISANKEIYDKAIRFREFVSQAEMLEERHGIYAETCKGLEQHMTVLPGSTEELEQELENLPALIAGKQEALTAQKDTVALLRAERDAKARKHECLLSEQGGLIAAQRAFERALSSGAAELEHMASEGKLGVSTIADSATDLDAFRALRNSFDAALAFRRQELTQQFSHERTANDAHEKQLLDEAQKWRNIVRDASISRDQRVESAARIKKRLESINAELSVQNDVPDYAPRAAELRNVIAMHSDALQKEGLFLRISQADAQITDLEKRRDTLTREIAVSTRHAEQHAAYARAERELERLRTQLERAVAAINKGQLQESRPEEMSRRAAEIVVQSKRTLDEREQVLTENQRLIVRLDAAREVAQAQLLEHKERVASLDAEASAVLGTTGQNVEDALQEANEEISILRESMSVLEHAAAFFQRILRQGRERHVCIGCNRAISSSEMGAFEAHVHESLQRSQPEHVTELENDLAAWSTHKTRYQRACELQKQAAQVRAQVAALEKEAADAEHKCSGARAALHRATEEADTAARDYDATRALQDTVVEVHNLVAAVRTCEAQVESLALDGIPESTDPGELERVIEQLSQAKGHHTTLVAARDAVSTAISAAEKELHAIELNMARVREHSSQRAAAQLRRDELVGDLTDHTNAVAKLDSEIAAAEEPASIARAALEKFSADRAAAERTASECMAKLEHYAARSIAVGGSVDDSVAEGLGERMKSCAESVSAMADALAEASRVLERAEAEVSEMQEAVHAAQAHASNLRDNLRYRKTNADMAAVDRELDELNLEEALAKHNQFSTEYDTARREENELSGRAAHLRGELQGIHAQISSREEELRVDYRDVEERYIKKLVHIRVGAMANHDLDKYSAALQHAILQFHSIKMEEINQTLDYLWKKTYQGTDIDTVLIRTEADGKMTATGMRSYQYRVCMVKDGVEMDMRGRCSAGQKVLACILIRLALADSFGSNTGFLALDEPTTNLDRENVEALAASVVDLIEERRHQNNFQLILITHDEDFLTRLAQSAAISQYWRVSRDEQLVRILN